MTANTHALKNIYFLDLMPDEDSGYVRRFAESIELFGSSANAITEITYVRLKNKRVVELFLLDRFLDVDSHAKGYCIFHIDAHADADGIDIDGEILPWRDFFSMLRPFNIVLRNRLLINFAACRAAWSVIHLDMTKPAPFFGINGPEIDISASHCVAIYTPFYKSLFEDRNFKSARAAMLKVAADLKIKFITSTSYTFFWDGIENFLDVLSRGKNRRQRVDALVTKLTSAGLNGPAMRKQVKERLWADQTLYVISAWRRFSMVEKYPELADEFGYAAPAKYSYLSHTED